MSAEIREEVLKLMQEKDKIEVEIKELTAILTHNGLGMNDPLVDAEGFPLNNIDIYQVRHARHRIICLQNDHKSIMKQIENGLHGYYNTASTTNGNYMEVDEDHHRIAQTSHKTPFAKVSFVNEASPAEYCGLQVNDLLVEFGSVNATNFRNVTDIANVVQHSEGQILNVKVKRGERYALLSLLPKKWAGRGLIGCNIIALN